MTTYILTLTVVTTDTTVATFAWDTIAAASRDLATAGIDVTNSINALPEGADDEEGDAG